MLWCAQLLAAGVGAGARSEPFYGTHFERMPRAAELTALGRELFFDPRLSASGKLSCANCHDPQHDFGPPDAEAVQRGGGDGQSFGVRAVPSLKYSQNIPPFAEHYIDDDGDDSVDQGPAGGRSWDGRAQSLHQQARLPLFSPFEMANPDADALLARLQGGYAKQLKRIFGAKIAADKALEFKGVLMALEAFQQSPEEFYPYNSKYDAYLRRETNLNPQELRGLRAFSDPEKGNCARCHPSAMQRGAFPQFTDYGYAAIGVPRNFQIAANADPHYFDLGLCGPLRTDLRAHAEYCGMFKTPSLRNVARRAVFMHNGVFGSLSDVVRFYAGRDTAPQKWYPLKTDGSVEKFDDLPSAYQGNVDVQAPFDRKPSAVSRLGEQDILDIVAFLQTLSDGFNP